MFYQAPEGEATIFDKTIAGSLIRKQLDQLGIGRIADYMESLKNKDNAALGIEEEPAIVTNRRRARPFTELTSVVTDEDATASAQLLDLTRRLSASQADRVATNQELTVTDSCIRKN